jgi:hypothetical protein
MHAAGPPAAAPASPRWRAATPPAPAPAPPGSPEPAPAPAPLPPAPPGSAEAAFALAAEAAIAYMRRAELSPGFKPSPYPVAALHRLAEMFFRKAQLAADPRFMRAPVPAEAYFATWALEMDVLRPGPHVASLVRAAAGPARSAFLAGDFVALAPAYDMAAGLVLADMLAGADAGTVRNQLAAGRYGALGCDTFAHALARAARDAPRCAGAAAVSVGVVTDIGVEADDQQLVLLLGLLAQHRRLDVHFFVGASTDVCAAPAQELELRRCLAQAGPALARAAVTDVAEVAAGLAPAGAAAGPGGPAPAAARLDYLLVCSPLDVPLPAGASAGALLAALGVGPATVVVMQSCDRFNMDKSAPPFRDELRRLAADPVAVFVGMTSAHSRLRPNRAVMQHFVDEGMGYALDVSLDWSLRMALCPAHCDTSGPFCMQLVQDPQHEHLGGAAFTVLDGLLELFGHGMSAWGVPKEEWV